MSNDEFKVVQTYLNTMEGELAKNLLISNGIDAMLSNDDGGGTRPELNAGKGVRVVVRAENLEEAKLILEGDHSEELTDESALSIDELKQQNDEAAKEFAEMKNEELLDKASRVKSTFKSWTIAIGVSIIVFFVIPNRTIAPRLALAVLFYAVIEFFTWRDCLKAQEILAEKSSVENE